MSLNKMKKDIDSRADIELMVIVFYERIKKDKLLGCIFQDVAQVNLALHIQKMTDFWENVIFQTGSYEGNPMNLHTKLHKVVPLTEAQFEQWNELFTDSIFCDKSSLTPDCSL
jgi:hemoglobin